MTESATTTTTDAQAVVQAVPIGVLGMLGFLVVADARVIDPLLPVIATSFNTSIAAAGLTISAYTLPYGVFQLVYGPLGDRAGKLRIMSIAILAFAVGTAVCAAAASLETLIALRFLTGVAAAALIPLSLAYIGDTVPYGERQAALGRYLSAIALGQILGASLGATVADVLSWRLIFLAYGLAALGVGLKFGRIARRQPLPPVTETAEPGPRTVKRYARPYIAVLRESAARVVLVTVCLEGLCFFGGFVYVGASLRDRYGLPFAAIGLILAGFGVGGIIYARIIGRLLPRLGERRLVLLGGSLIISAYLAIAFTPAWQPIPALVVITGIGFYMLHSTLQTKATELAPDARGTAVALFAFFLFLGQSLGALFFGQIVTRAGYTPALALSATLVALIALFFASRVNTLPGGAALAEQSTHNRGCTIPNQGFRKEGRTFR
ncbi:MAG TPA: MFS transporter [Thermomicrobiales bacterium]|nr:MFS transporter [Thermomicrobiales bacterium]